MSNLPVNKRGKLFIFNMFNIENGASKQRLGSEQDVENLKSTFELMNADVAEPFIDFTKDEVQRKMKEIQNEDFSSYDYVAISFSSHGYEDSTAFTSDREFIYLHRTFMIPLQKNKTLSKKLKWIITQTCRGALEMEAEGIVNQSQKLLIDPRYYLISYATTEGFVSRRSQLNGSFFIQGLCKELRTHYNDKDIIYILNRVSETVREISLRDSGKEQRPCYEHNFGSNFSFTFFHTSWFNRNVRNKYF